MQNKDKVIFSLTLIGYKDKLQNQLLQLADTH